MLSSSVISSIELCVRETEFFCTVPHSAYGVGVTLPCSLLPSPAFNKRNQWYENPRYAWPDFVLHFPVKTDEKTRGRTWTDILGDICFLPRSPETFLVIVRPTKDDILLRFPSEKQLKYGFFPIRSIQTKVLYLTKTISRVFCVKVPRIWDLS